MDGLSGVHISNIVNEVIRTISSLFIYSLFILQKIFKRTKTQIKQTSTHRTRIITQKKQQRQQFFSRRKTSKRMEIIFSFCVLVLLLHPKSFRKKTNKQTRNCPKSLY